MKKNLPPRQYPSLFLSTLVVIVFVCSSFAHAADLSSTHFIVRDPVLDAGGGYQASGSFKLYGADNNNLSGDGGSSTSFKAHFGFLYYPYATSGVLSVLASGSSINVSWTATDAGLGFNISGYKLGISSTSGGPYTYTSVGNVTSYTYTTMTPGTYYLSLQSLDAFGDVIATSNEATVTIQEIISFSLSTNTVSFGALTSNAPRYATTSNGSSVDTSAHTISAESNSSSGYSILYNGSTLDSQGNAITPATISGSTTGTPGTAQFALSLSTTGAATITSSYDQTNPNWNFVSNSPDVIATTTGPTPAQTFNAYYLANIPPLAAAGDYSTTLNYLITANY